MGAASMTYRLWIVFTREQPEAPWRCHYAEVHRARQDLLRSARTHARTWEVPPIENGSFDLYTM
jgi:hypothetical protein